MICLACRLDSIIWEINGILAVLERRGDNDTGGREIPPFYYIVAFGGSILEKKENCCVFA